MLIERRLLQAAGCLFRLAAGPLLDPHNLTRLGQWHGRRLGRGSRASTFRESFV